MVSRRKILSRSSDDLNFEAKQDLHDEEDVWHQKEKLFKVGKGTKLKFNFSFSLSNRSSSWLVLQFTNATRLLATQIDD